MKVRYCLRSNHREVQGGDLVQLHATAVALQDIGVAVDVDTAADSDLSAYDVVHIFNSPYFEETRAFMANAKRQGKPVAFSTIYWSKDEMAAAISPKTRDLRALVGHRLSVALYRALRAVLRANAPERLVERELLRNADLWLPNSLGEQCKIERDYGFRGHPACIVCNAIDSAHFAPAGRSHQPYVLSVGRIEARKNTAALVEACARLGVELVLAGPVERGVPYNEACLERISRHGFRHLEHPTRSDLMHLYHEAKVHALVSWYETPGLASLEAAAAGCNIVTTDRGSTREYFRHHACYCSPASNRSILQALRTALAAPASLELAQFVARQYTWNRAAVATLAGYRQLAPRA